MATLLDANIIGLIAPIIIFLFIMLVSFAVLDKFKLMGENKALHALVAFCIGVLFLFSKTAVGVVIAATPWFVVMIVLGMFIISLFLFLGVKEESLGVALKEPKVYWTILLIIIIFLVVVITNVYKANNPVDESTTSGSPNEGINALVNPKVLGAVVLLVIAAFAVSFISESLVTKSK